MSLYVRPPSIQTNEPRRSWANVWAFLTSLGHSFGVFVRPLCLVPRTSGRELSLILLFGTFLSFMATFVIVSKPGVVVCAITRFAVGFCYTGKPKV